MVKKCRVLLNNSAVTVFKFDDVTVQAPSINRDAECVNVLFDENHFYTIVDDSYVEEPNFEEPTPTKKKKSSKKTTVEEVESEANVIESTEVNE